MKAIIRKELLEWFNAGSIGKWGRYEIFIAIAVIGVIPAFLGGTAAGPALCIYACFGPVMITAAAMADSFAGERERGTLQSLFLLPLRDADILGGKIGGVVAYALIQSIGGLLLGSIALKLTGSTIAPIWMYAASVGGCLFLSVLFSSFVAFIALGNVTARQAQTYAMTPFYAAILLAVLLPKLGVRILPQADIVLVVTMFAAWPMLGATIIAMLILVADVLLLAACRRRLRNVRYA